MSAQHPDFSKHGFQGNPDLYGIGIRAGYYTQAASLWVANLFAPHEAPFRQTVTQLFIISIIVGICQLSVNRTSTHAVEPFMLMQIAYNTSFMGIYGYPTPGLLRWERNYGRQLTAEILTLALHSYDLWFWYIGRLILLPTNGPEGNPIYFPYIGRVDLYGWAHYMAKVTMCIPLSLVPLQMVYLLAYGYQQWGMDRAMPPSRFTGMTAQWLEEAQFVDPVDACLEKPSSVWISEGGQEPGPVESHEFILPKLSRSPSGSQKDLRRYIGSKDPSQEEISQLPTDHSFKVEKTSFRSQQISGQETEFTLIDKEVQQAPSSPEPLGRTKTDLFQSAILGKPWFTNSNGNPGVAQNSKGTQRYSRHHSHVTHEGYSPSFAELFETETFLIAISSPSRIRFQRWISLRDYFLAPFTLLPLLLTRRLRPSVLLATLSHASNQGQSCQLSKPGVIHRALTHPSYPNLDWRNVAILSRIHLTLNPPPPITKVRRLFHGWMLFGVCAVLVIGTELTIQWNYITGINNINSVGQLVPFTVGVGGLIKVCWSAVFDKEERESRWEDKCTVAEKVAPWMEAADGWKRVRGAFESRCKAIDPLEEDPLKGKVGF